MKLKFYLRGLGIGILVTTLILTVAHNVKDSEKALANNNSTVSSISNLNKTETKAVSTEKSSEQKTEQQTTVTEPAATEVSTETIKENPTVTATESAQQKETVKDTNNTITVVLSNLTDSEGAAQAIQSAGIIDDWKDFNNYLSKSGYAVKIRNGTYNLFKGQDYESIAKIISGR